MTIDFSGFEAPEGFPVEALQTPELAKFLDSYVEKQKEVSTTLVKEELNSLKTQKVISDEKLEKARSELEQAKRNPATTNEKVKELEQKLETAGQDIKTEYEAKLEAVNAKYAERETEYQKLSGELDRTNTSTFIRDGINQYNSKFPTVKVAPGAENYLIEAGLKHYQRTESGGYRAYEGDQALTGSEGFMSQVEFISHLSQKPEYQIFFEKPKGGGATSVSKGGGVVQAGALGGTKEQRIQAFKNKFPELPSG